MTQIQTSPLASRPRAGSAGFYIAAGPTAHDTPPREQSAEVCRNFNAGKCRMPSCRFRQVCKECDGLAPAISGCNRQLGLQEGDYPQSSTRRFATSVSHHKLGALSRALRCRHLTRRGRRGPIGPTQGRSLTEDMPRSRDGSTPSFR